MINKHKQNLKQKMDKKQETRTKLMRLRLYALQKGFNSIYHLASYIGVTYPYIWQIVSGKRKPSKKFLQKFRKKMGVDFYEILEDKNENKRGN